MSVASNMDRDALPARRWLTSGLPTIWTYSRATAGFLDASLLAGTNCGSDYSGVARQSEPNEAVSGRTGRQPMEATRYSASPSYLALSCQITIWSRAD